MSQSRKLSRRQFLKLVGGTAVGTMALGTSGAVYSKEIEPRSLAVG